jgi:pimeloyl-ACP methyl ester carboxylesterase
MQAVFVHGVADTYRLWDDVRSHLSSVTSTALMLPGFGVGVPHGFTPVDLVGHDWGAMFSMRVASLRTDLVRTVAAGNGPICEDYEWHRLAKIWQTPGDGETFMRDLTQNSFSRMLESLGVPSGAAERGARHVDDRMKQCILELYRSAVHVGKEWQGGLAGVQCPAMIFWGIKDTECPVRYAHQMAEHLPRSRVIELDCGHWVPIEKPEELAALLLQQWASADAGN